MKNYHFLIAIAILLISVSVKAQEKWSVEFRPGLNFPTVDMGDIDAKIGFGFEFTTAYKIMPHLAAYAGWGWNEFKGDDNFLNEDIAFQESGFTVGFQIIRPMGTSAFSYVGSAGAIYNHIELENKYEENNADTGYGWGWQLALGVDYEFASNLSLRPMLRYRSLSRNLEIANVSTDLKLNYISFGVGLAYEF